MVWARPGSWLDSGGRWGRGFVDPWGVRGFVNGFVHSWVRELVAGFVDWFTRFRVRGVSFPKASAKGSRLVRNYTGEKLHHRLECVPANR